MKMKKIPVWLVLLLNIITLGIYSLFWLIKRRSEIQKQYKRGLPHWSWLIMAPLAIPVLVLVVAGLTFVLGLDEFATGSAIIGTALISVTVAAAIYIWWAWEFSRAAQYVNNGKFTADWSLALAIIAGLPIMAMFQQYYFNRALAPHEAAKKVPAQPSEQVKLISVTVIIVSLLLFIAASVGGGLGSNEYGFNEFQVPPVGMDTNMKEIDQEVDRLTREYDKCMDKLDRKFPEVTAENESIYDEEYGRCDTIRQKQDEAINKYDEFYSSSYSF